MGLGAVIQPPEGVPHLLSVHTHAVGCNNEAELRALIAALSQALSMGATHVQLHTDNSVLLEHLGPWPQGQAVRRIERLEALFGQARSLMACLAQVQLLWVPRHRNGQADALARAALGMSPKPSAASRHKRR